MIGGSVVVSDPGFLPTTRQMALAVADELSAYLTPLWFDSGARLVGWPVVGPELARRTLPDVLHGRALRVASGTELARLALGRTGFSQAAARFVWRRNERADRAAAKLIPEGATVIGQYGASLATFERCQAGGGTTILDYPLARLDYCSELLAEEAVLRPDFADTIIGPATLQPPDEQLRRISHEVQLADAVVVGSAFAAASFREHVDERRLHVVPYGVDNHRFFPARAPRSGRRLRVLFAGQISQRKGIGYALDAIRLLDPDRFELTLVGPVVGSGSGLCRYESLFEHASVRPDEMPDVYRRADVLVLPSLVEGSALVVLEAMASGLPVVVTDNVGADAVRDGVEGFVVPIRSPEAIASRLEDLERDTDLCDQIGERARRRALGFGWTTFHERFRAVVGLEQAAIATPSAVSLERGAS